ncbi:hypothetical protein RhiTH_011407, partial [Rhizoctonia solani]
MEVSYDGTIGAVYIGIVDIYWHIPSSLCPGLMDIGYPQVGCASSTGYELLITQFDVIGPAFRGTWGGFLVFCFLICVHLIYGPINKLLRVPSLV